MSGEYTYFIGATPHTPHSTSSEEQVVKLVLICEPLGHDTPERAFYLERWCAHKATGAKIFRRNETCARTCYYICRKETTNCFEMHFRNFRNPGIQKRSFPVRSSLYQGRMRSWLLAFEAMYWRWAEARMFTRQVRRARL